MGIPLVTYVARGILFIQFKNGITIRVEKLSNRYGSINNYSDRIDRVIAF